jgi:hypothetical protein
MTVSTSPSETWWARCSFVSTWLAACRFAAAGPGHEAVEEPARPRQVGRQLLGVTLHRNDKPVVGLHAFDGVVLALRRLVQPRRQALDRLVVEAVDADLVLAGRVAELRRGVDLNGVSQVLAAVTAHVVVVEVLHQRTAQGYVDHLLAAADAEDRQLPLARLLEEPQLGLVQLAVDGSDLVVLRLAVEGRVDVPPTR